jgi:hypothetical protein
MLHSTTAFQISQNLQATTQRPITVLNCIPTKTQGSVLCGPIFVLKLLPDGLPSGTDPKVKNSNQVIENP